MYTYIHCIYVLGCLDESLKKVLEDSLLDVDPAGGEADLSLVDEGRSDHGRHTLVQVRVRKHNPCILAAQLWGGGETEREVEKQQMIAVKLSLTGHSTAVTHKHTESVRIFRGRIY